MNIITWNVNSIKMRLEHVEQLLKDKNPDVIGIQELKCETEAFPNETIVEAGYEAYVYGQKAYNGVALLVKKGLTVEDVEMGMPHYSDEQARVIAATVNQVRCINVYVPNGQAVGSDKYHYKLAWLDAFANYLKASLAKYTQVVVMGDFNIAPHDDDVYNPTIWKDKILCSLEERQALELCLLLGLSDAFRLFAQPKHVYSWWDYRNQGFERNEGLRIDLLLVNQAVNARALSCQTLEYFRGLERPSDHAPVLLELFSDIVKDKS